MMKIPTALLNGLFFFKNKCPLKIMNSYSLLSRDWMCPVRMTVYSFEFGSVLQTARAKQVDLYLNDLI